MRSGKRVLYAVAPVLVLVVLLGCSLRFATYIHAGVYPAYRFLQGRIIAVRTGSTEPIETDGFIIHSRPGIEAGADEIIDIAHLYSAGVYEFFGYDRSRPVEIVLFDDEKELKKALFIPEDLSAIGAYAGGRINLLGPESLSEGSAEGNRPENVFVHELAHLVMDDICRGNYPMWFTEGSSLYVEYLLLGYEWGAGFEYDRVYTVDELTQSFSELDEQAAYRQSFLLVRGLVEGYGAGTYRSLLHALGKGEPFETAFCRIYGFDSRKLAEQAQ